MYETILFEKGNSVATIALNRPDKLNSFNGTLHEEIYEALNEQPEMKRCGVSCCGGKARLEAFGRRER